MNHKTRLQSLFDAALMRNAEKVAFRTLAQTLTYSQLETKIQKAAAGLLRSGVGAEDRVAWLLPNCLEAVITTLACYRIGAIAVPLNHRYVFEEAKDVLDRTGSKLLVYHVECDEVAEKLHQSNPSLQLFAVGESRLQAPPFRRLIDHDDQTEFVPVGPDAPALILFTSGSTGRPKGVIHSHNGAFCAIDVSRRVFQFKERDVVLVGKPISHAGGLQTQMLPTLLAGGEVVLEMKPKPETAVRLIRQHQVTEYGMLASDLLDFVEYLEQHPTDLPSLKNAIGSGDSVPVDLHHRFRDLFGWEVMEGAGMTEVGGYYAANPLDGNRKWGSLGLPTPETQLQLVDDDGQECKETETGEILIRCPSNTNGYWQDEVATRKLYQGKWLRTGDLARRDEDGYIWFVGRKKLMIIRRGSNIAPAEVENILDQHPLVHASVVVGVDDEHEGQIPVACIALLEHPTDETETQLRTFVNEHLAAYKNPVHYLFLDELPRTGTGKFDRHRLHKAAAKRFSESAG